MTKFYTFISLLCGLLAVLCVYLLLEQIQTTWVEPTQQNIVLTILCSLVFVFTALALAKSVLLAHDHGLLDNPQDPSDRDNS